MRDIDDVVDANDDDDVLCSLRLHLLQCVDRKHIDTVQCTPGNISTPHP